MANSPIQQLERRVLHALFALSRDTLHISAGTLADAVGTTPTRAAAALIALERAGLCDASRARLTMLGLATAAQMGSARGGSPAGKRMAEVRQLRVATDDAEPLAASGASPALRGGEAAETPSAPPLA